eukprot:EC795060.1.p1 GENE.EC795060.1~~EC795060.1.p1  ORF type:complete len:181 (+),score=50.85 EC795060.1:33-575(+)
METELDTGRAYVPPAYLEFLTALGHRDWAFVLFHSSLVAPTRLFLRSEVDSLAKLYPRCQFIVVDVHESEETNLWVKAFGVFDVPEFRVYHQTTLKHELHGTDCCLENVLRILEGLPPVTVKLLSSPVSSPSSSSSSYDASPLSYRSSSPASPVSPRPSSRVTDFYYYRSPAPQLWTSPV